VLIDWSDEFDTWLNRLEEQADSDPISARRLDYVTAQLQLLQELSDRPTEDTASMRRVRQSGRHLVWRLSHPFDPDIAVRLIVWFPDEQHAVIALFAGDKARMGDVFYNSVGTRADAAIEKWQREDRS
jgi:hypothetical protein